MSDHNRNSCYTSLPYIEQNSNSQYDNKNISIYDLDNHLPQTSYAITSNYTKLTSTSGGSWGSTTFIPACRNQVKSPNYQTMLQSQEVNTMEVNNYTADCNQEQKRQGLFTNLFIFTCFTLAGILMTPTPAYLI